MGFQLALRIHAIFFKQNINNLKNTLYFLLNLLIIREAITLFN